MHSGGVLLSRAPASRQKTGRRRTRTRGIDGMGPAKAENGHGAHTDNVSTSGTHRPAQMWSSQTTTTTVHSRSQTPRAQYNQGIRSTLIIIFVNDPGRQTRCGIDWRWCGGA